jgi:hypothetical protein
MEEFKDEKDADPSDLNWRRTKAGGEVPWIRPI